ncbi:hypothetical protein [Marinospirillum insulare]|uniref:PEGA domain-containing protein n=1 Tax=Marinospirillum insulare TaxID=217169 RepID=A0ABQ6A0B3_9GAMM|nr:hypothetical protein [Marinospirillum insulare]GLR64798.1 hypothetical protein GCM10007878_22360 [Marinospirillum insulare]
MIQSIRVILSRISWVLVFSLLCSGFAWAENYQGQGSTREQAREDLAQQILTTVKSQFESDIQIEEGAFTKNVSQSSKQSSNVILTGVKVKQTDDGQYLATLNKAQFRKDAALTLNKVIAACKTQLPEAWQPRRQVLTQCVQDVDAAISMARVVGKKSEINQLSELRTNIYNEYNKALVVIASTPEVGYSLDGKTFSNGSSHRVNSGEHTIIWQDQGYCKHQETFTIKAGEEISFNPKLGRTPQITFLSPNLDAYLTVNGKDATLGEVHELEECHGMITYSISNDYDSKTDKIRLKPNLSKEVNQRLLTEQEAAKIKQRKEAAEAKLKARQERTANYTNAYTDLNALQLIYGYSVASKYENTHRLRLEAIKNFSAIRYGLGVMYGSSTDSQEYEIYAQAALQLPEFGGHPLSIYGWSFVPYAGAELGLGYHERYHEKLKTKTHKFASSSEFSRDKLVVRYLAGLDIPVSKELAVKLQASKQTSMEKSIEFSLGISMHY